MLKSNKTIKILAIYMSIFLAFNLFIYNPSSDVFAKTPPKTFKVAIDAGHGGIDKGTYGRKTKTPESQVNLEIATELALQLENLGIKTVQTRDGDYGLYGEATPGFKRRDMLMRKKIIEDFAPDLAISLHCNYSSASKPRGTEVYYNAENPVGKVFAEKLQVAILEIPSIAKCRLDTVNLFMTHKIDVPSVIVECGFLSNALDEELLCDKKFQRELCKKLCRAILDTLSATTSSDTIFQNLYIFANSL